jgi:hypothetical protein
VRAASSGESTETPFRLANSEDSTLQNLSLRCRMSTGFGLGFFDDSSSVDDHDLSPLSARASDGDFARVHLPTEKSSNPLYITAWTGSTTAPTCARTENPDARLRALQDGGNDVASSESSEAPVLVQASGKPAKCKAGKVSSRKRWTPEEEGRFLKALERFGPKEVGTDPCTGRISVCLGPGVAELISMVVGTRSVTQARSHAQKHFIRKMRETARDKAAVGHGSDARTG